MLLDITLRYMVSRAMPERIQSNARCSSVGRVSCAKSVARCSCVKALCKAQRTQTKTHRKDNIYTLTKIYAKQVDLCSLATKGQNHAVSNCDVFKKA
jgi:hypothetical protein